MTEHTTIQITKAQADELQARKTHDDESYKSVIARLLDGDNSGTDTDELAERLERIESSVSTVEGRTGSIESTLEGLQR